MDEATVATSDVGNIGDKNTIELLSFQNN